MNAMAADEEGTPISAFHISDKEFVVLKSLVEARLGISMPETKRAMLETRLVRRLRQLQMKTASEYCRYLESEKGKATEISKFLDLVTTNKTSFFRELPQLNALQENVLPNLLMAASRSGRPLRVWSAACSTGQEVWTLIMMIERTLQTHSISADYVVWGSDVSGRVLETAVAAKYEQAELTELDSYYGSRFFMRAKDPNVRIVRVRPEYRRHAGFFHQNLMDATYAVPNSVDLALLRNALIYFSRDKQSLIVNQVARYLNPNAIFAVGLTESLHGMKVPFSHLGQSIYQLGGAR